LAYVNGNLALQPKQKQEDQTEVVHTKRVVVTRRSLPVQEKLLYLFTVLVCVVVAGVIISRYAQIYTMNVEIKQLNSNLKTVSVELEDLKKQVETLGDPERIRKLAETQGMVSSTDGGIMLKTSSNGLKSALRE
jgi:cell division protein FtsL